VCVCVFCHTWRCSLRLLSGGSFFVLDHFSGERERETRQAGRLVGRQANKQTERDRQTGRHAGKQRDRQIVFQLPLIKNNRRRLPVIVLLFLVVVRNVSATCVSLYYACTRMCVCLCVCVCCEW